MRLTEFYYSPAMISPPSDKTPEIRPLAALVLGAVAVGASPVFLRLGEVGPYAAAFHRVFLALPILWVWYRLAENRNDAGAADIRLADAGLMLLAGFFFAGDLVFWHLSLFHTAVANATLFANTAPVFVVAAGWLFFRQSVSGTFVAGMVLALAGAVLLVHESVRFAPARIDGDLYGLTTAVFLAGYLMTVENLCRRFGAARVMFWSTLSTAGWLMPAALIAGGPYVPSSTDGWLMLAALAWFSHAFGQGAIAYALGSLPASLTAVGLLLEPLAAALFAALLLSEALTGWQAVAGLVILGGIAIARSARAGDIKY